MRSGALLVLVPLLTIGCRDEPRPARTEAVTQQAAPAPAARSAPDEATNSGTLATAAALADTVNALPHLPDSAQADWRTYDGPAFSLRHPPDATVWPGTEDGEPVLLIEGPRIVLLTDNEYTGNQSGPMYQLAIAVYPNTNRWTAEQWVDSIRHASNDGQTDPDSTWYLAPPYTVTSGSVRALELEPWCGDCALEDLYLADERHRVRVSISYGIHIPGDREAQRKLYLAILGTFAWKPAPDDPAQ